MGILNPPASGVTVRMYRQGLGDCFLLAFPTEEAGRAYYMLIDCGVMLRTSDENEIMTHVAKDIVDATGGDVHLLVVTARHWDHLSGFIQARDIFESMRIHNLWLAWTENQDDPLASTLGGELQQDLTTLRMAVNRAPDPASVQHITNLVELHGSLNGTASPDNGSDGAGMGNTEDALQALLAFANKMQSTLQYRYPNKDAPLPLASGNGLPNVPGVRLYVLGPPYDETSLKNINSTAQGDKTNGVPSSGSALTAASALRIATLDKNQLSPQDLKNQLSPEDRQLRKLSYPFPKNPTVIIPREQAEEYNFFQQHYGFSDASNVSSGANSTSGVQGPAFQRDDLSWRRIDDHWVRSGEALALQVNKYTNNTSLALAIELVNSQKVLMFVSDALIGNWLSWDDLSWSITDATGSPKTIGIGDLLARTVLYKVSHHGSLNGTLRGSSLVPKGLELMTSRDLVAMISVDQQEARKRGWGQMPSVALLQRLNVKTQGLVLRSDAPLSQKPDAIDDVTWQAFQANYQVTDLYVQYTVTE